MTPSCRKPSGASGKRMRPKSPRSSGLWTGGRPTRNMGSISRAQLTCDGRHRERPFVGVQRAIVVGLRYRPTRVTVHGQEWIRLRSRATPQACRRETR
ncbi:hypothetical protein MPNT_10056 [Candidatus Methylacidithermus pantelleriae]|uniref:Uncharacterized protein n=1 Tax=Candidatus Methylacidithermus pantelleriae TaxID=2744239 RepID=A0A8J2BJ27_9BACT|nr:hypothetical protein MPNT_10056 [Candidatus Methylacidithermus pantelleriae]